MTAPSVPRCGRMDPHAPHQWTRPSLGVPNQCSKGNRECNCQATHLCPGVVVHEGGARCKHCRNVVCTCDPRELEAYRAEMDDNYWEGS